MSAFNSRALTKFSVAVVRDALRIVLLGDDTRGVRRQEEREDQGDVHASHGRQDHEPRPVPATSVTCGGVAAGQATSGNRRRDELKVSPGVVGLIRTCCNAITRKLPGGRFVVGSSVMRAKESCS